ALTTQTTTIPPTTTIFQNSSYQQSPLLPSCGSNYTLFSKPLFDPNAIVSLMPVGEYIPPDHVFPAPHSYVYTYNPTTGQTKGIVYLYSPGNMVLTQLAIRNLSSVFYTH